MSVSALRVSGRGVQAAMAFRRLALAIAAAVFADTVCAAGSVIAAPDFSSYASREEAIVVSIKTVTPRRPRLLDRDLAALTSWRGLPSEPVEPVARNT